MKSVSLKDDPLSRVLSLGRSLFAMLPIGLAALISLFSAIIYGVQAWYAPYETIQDIPLWFGALSSALVFLGASLVIFWRLRSGRGR